jgi:hypothetical protein
MPKAKASAGILRAAAAEGSLNVLQRQHLPWAFRHFRHQRRKKLGAAAFYKQW